MQAYLNSQKLVILQSVLIKILLWEILLYPVFIINMKDSGKVLIFYKDFSHCDRDSNGEKEHLKC